MFGSCTKAKNQCFVWLLSFGSNGLLLVQ